MAWSPSQKVADCRDISRKWKCDQVLIIGIDKQKGQVIGASYGKTMTQCRVAGLALDQFLEQIESGEVAV